jgi:hypothetical protein
MIRLNATAAKIASLVLRLLFSQFLCSCSSVSTPIKMPSSPSAWRQVGFEELL